MRRLVQVAQQVDLPVVASVVLDQVIVDPAPIELEFGVISAR